MKPRGLRVAIMTDEPGWHGARLRRALRAHGVDAAYADLAGCRIDLGAQTDGVVIPGFAERLPDGVFVRGIAAGTLESITLRLDFLHALDALGVPVYNEAGAIERSVDKARTSFLLKHAGIPTPPTWVCESGAQAHAVLMREFAAGHDVVLKPLFGSQGRGLRRLRPGANLPDIAEYGGVWYLQRYIGAAHEGWRDWRVLVAGRSALAAMVRVGRTWISNVAQGARCERATLDGALERLAVDAVDAVGMDYAGVDIMRDRDGRLTVIELNSIPAWKGLQSVTRFDIAGRLVDDFLSRRLEWMHAPRLEVAC